MIMAESVHILYGAWRIKKLEKQRRASETHNKPFIITADKTDRYSALRGAK